MKRIRFHKSVEKELATLSEEVRVDLAESLGLLSRGMSLGMPVSRPMPSLGLGNHELRLKDRAGIYRFFYYVKLKDAILIYHCFMKKTQATPISEIKTGKKRLGDLL